MPSPTCTLRRLNLDSSWLLTLPAAEDHPTRTVNLVIDPWLDEAEQVDYHVAFSAQKRRAKALVASIAELEEMLAGEAKAEPGDDASRPASTRVDCILLSHPFTDHTHPQTLCNPTLPARIPFLVTRDARNAVQALIGTDRNAIHTIDIVGPKSSAPDWTTPRPAAGLPSNITVAQAVPREWTLTLQGPAGLAWKKLHGALFIMWKCDEAAPPRSIVYSPHGVTTSTLPPWLTSASWQHEALITSFDRLTLPAWISGVVNLGLPPALPVSQRLACRRIIDTHGEDKQARGVIAKLLQRHRYGTDGDAQTLIDRQFPSSYRPRAHLLAVGASLTM